MAFPSPTDRRQRGQGIREPWGPQLHDPSWAGGGRRMQMPGACRPISCLGAHSRPQSQSQSPGATGHTWAVRWFMAGGEGGRSTVRGRVYPRILRQLSPDSDLHSPSKTTAAPSLPLNSSGPQTDACLSQKAEVPYPPTQSPNVQPSRAAIFSRREDRELPLLSTHC